MLPSIYGFGVNVKIAAILLLDGEEIFDFDEEMLEQLE